tara:strand:- start:138 stop:1001 length:864 start_codon:yes stop_codon:yes gene_type:complete
MSRNRDIASFLGKTEAANTDNSRLGAANELDSSLVTSLVDSAYIILRDRVRDSAFINALIDASALDSGRVTALIDSSYIQLRQTDLQRDSAFITSIIDSSYVTARASTFDSASATALIDSSYVRLRESPAEAGTDSAATIDIIADELSTFSVGDLVGADGNPGDTLISDGDGTASFTTLGGRSLEFKVTYIASGGTSIIDSIQSLPTGFTLDSQGDNSVIISHNLGRSVKDVTFNRYVGGTLKLKRSDSADLVTNLVADRLNKFTLLAGTVTTGADSEQYAYVNMMF